MVIPRFLVPRSQLLAGNAIKKSLTSDNLEAEPH
jgi:hypothetical protein